MFKDTHKHSPNSCPEIASCVKTSRTSDIDIGGRHITQLNTDIPAHVIVAIGAYLLFQSRESLGPYGSVRYSR